jgi:hypothetical protein
VGGGVRSEREEGEGEGGRKEERGAGRWHVFGPPPLYSCFSVFFSFLFVINKKIGAFYNDFNLIFFYGLSNDNEIE